MENISFYDESLGLRLEVRTPFTTRHQTCRVTNPIRRASHPNSFRFHVKRVPKSKTTIYLLVFTSEHQKDFSFPRFKCILIISLSIFQGESLL